MEKNDKKDEIDSIKINAKTWDEIFKEYWSSSSSMTLQEYIEFLKKNYYPPKKFQ
jgi:hypothetical protein